MKPDISIVVPVYNDQRALEELFVLLKKRCSNHTIEVVVVDAGDDSTTEKYLNKIDRYEKFTIQYCRTLKGRGYQLNKGGQLSNAESLLFLHADSRFRTDIVRIILQSLLRKPAGAFDLRIETTNPVVKIIGLFGSLRSRLTRIPYGDQGHFCTKKLFQEMGGYPKVPLFEDVLFMETLKRNNVDIAILKTKLLTSDRRWKIEGPVFTTLRNWLLMMAFRRGNAIQLLLQFYRTTPGTKLSIERLWSLTKRIISPAYEN